MLTLKFFGLISLSAVALSDNLFSNHNHGFTSGQLVTNISNYHCQPPSSATQKCNYYSDDYTNKFLYDNQTYLSVGYCVT